MNIKFKINNRLKFNNKIFEISDFSILTDFLVYTSKDEIYEKIYMEIKTFLDKLINEEEISIGEDNLEKIKLNLLLNNEEKELSKNIIIEIKNTDKRYNNRSKFKIEIYSENKFYMKFLVGYHYLIDCTFTNQLNNDKMILLSLILVCSIINDNFWGYSNKNKIKIRRKI